jgi:heavy metal sensor kinase
VAGLGALSILVVGGFAGSVYARARGVAFESLRADLRFRAETLAGLLEVGPDGVEFEVPRDTLPDFQRPGSGSFVEIVDGSGKVIVRSPSLGGARLPPPGPWEEGGESFSELPDGPGGVPCAVIARSFLARADADPPEPGSEAWTPPPPEGLRHRIQVALDSRERDRGLASLAWFLGLAGAGAVAAAVAGGLLLARLVLRPVHRMTREAATLDPADATRRLHPSTVVGELHSLAATLNSALDRLGAALERQKRFTSDASHELRTPVSALLAGTELLLRRPRTPEEYRRGLERQVRTIRRMKEITENLLALARADAAAEAPPREPLDAGEVLDAAAEEFLPLAEEKGIRLERAVAPGLRVRGDRQALARLCGNLLSNAVKFTPPGGRVLARAAPEGREALLEVEDSGPGIPPEHLPHVFERFYRVREGGDRAEGAGLGLAISEGIVRAHGGRIEASNLAAGGAAIRVRLPLLAGTGAAGDRSVAEVVGRDGPDSPGDGERMVGAGGGAGREGRP